MAAAKKTTAKTTVNAPEVEQTIQEPIVEPEPVHQRWEYARLRDGGNGSDLLLSRLQEAGTEGWEAISVDAYQGVAWLKRPVL
jgi:hypothetical protein